MEKIVPHDYKYHAEIQYEGETAMRFTCATGNTIEQLLWDIDYEINQIKNREPKIIEVLKNPNFKKEIITQEIIKLYYHRGGS